MSKFFINLLVGIQVVAAIAIIGLPYSPDWSELILFEYAINFSPRWLWLLLPLITLVFFRYFTLLKAIVLIVCLCVFIYFQDVQWREVNEPSVDNKITFISLNTGGGSNLKQLKKMIKQQKPDVVLLQEASNKTVNTVFDQSWKKVCRGGLCIASLFPVHIEDKVDRKIIAGWGSFIVAYRVTFPDKSLVFYNVHFETPRPILTALIHRHFDFKALDTLHENRMLQASILTTLANQKSNFVIAGDFNMTVNDRIYHQYFTQYLNVLSDVASGVNYTKYTSWHGARIDHVLLPRLTNVHYAEVLPAVGGDHRPLLIEL